MFSFIHVKVSREASRVTRGVRALLGTVEGLKDTLRVAYRSSDRQAEVRASLMLCISAVEQLREVLRNQLALQELVDAVEQSEATMPAAIEGEEGKN